MNRAQACLSSSQKIPIRPVLLVRAGVLIAECSQGLGGHTQGHAGLCHFTLPKGFRNPQEGQRLGKGVRRSQEAPHFGQVACGIIMSCEVLDPSEMG